MFYAQSTSTVISGWTSWKKYSSSSHLLKFRLPISFNFKYVTWCSLNETINWAPLFNPPPPPPPTFLYRCKKVATHKICSVDYENSQITQHVLNTCIAQSVCLTNKNKLEEVKEKTELERWTQAQFLATGQADNTIVWPASGITWPTSGFKLRKMTCIQMEKFPFMIKAVEGGGGGGVQEY